MPRFLIRRSLLALGTLWAVSVVLFLASQVLPGDTATAVAGRGADPARIAAVTEQLHLDRPAVVQYFGWLTSLLLGDPGTSLASGESVAVLISDRALNTLLLVVVAALVGVPLAAGLGVLAAVHTDTGVDHTVSLLTLVLAALPEFLIAVVLIIVFATNVLPILPPVSLMPHGPLIATEPRLLVLPAATLILAITPYIARTTRAVMVDELRSDHAEFARLNGNPESRVVRRALHNSLGPIAQSSAVMVGWMAGGAVLVEVVFSYPGLGTPLVDAVSNRDLPVLQAIALLLSAGYIAVNIGADLLAAAVNPVSRRRFS